ncbi:MAG: hypothetical protein C0614_06555 [Desulfuromonas sp.]|nr:MAG: hypothetical protein C0614_06555 [Desulfuromonas sp.]
MRRKTPLRQKNRSFSVANKKVLQPNYPSHYRSSPLSMKEASGRKCALGWCVLVIALSEQAIYNYLAMKIILPIAFVSFYMVTLFVYKLEAEAVLSIIFLLIFGFFIPNLWVYLMTKARQERIFKGLPDALDLMVVCVESGLGLDMTFQRVGDEIRPICKDISDEFILTNLEVRAGKQRDEAFRNMTLRTGNPEINNLMTVLNQTSRFGTSLAKALRVHADAMRVKRRQIAEETAAKAAVKLVFPLVLFIFPAIFVVLIGPGAIKIVKYLIPALSGGG